MNKIIDHAKKEWRASRKFEMPDHIVKLIETWEVFDKEYTKAENQEDGQGGKVPVDPVLDRLYRDLTVALRHFHVEGPWWEFDFPGECPDHCEQCFPEETSDYDRSLASMGDRND